MAEHTDRRTIARPGTDEDSRWPAGLRVEYGPAIADGLSSKAYEVFVDGVSIGRVEHRDAYQGRAGRWAAAGWGWRPSFTSSQERTPQDRRRTRTAATAAFVRMYLDRQAPKPQ